MAITKIGAYRNPPEDISDFQAINELLMAYARDLGGQGMVLTEWTNSTDYPKLAMGSYLFHGGASYLVDTEDYEISNPADGTYYLKIEADDETLAVSWISSLTGYAWNPIYNGLYHPDESQVLPYQLIVSGAVKEKWKIVNLAQVGGFIRSNWQGSINAEGFLNVGGAIKGTHINTGQGDFKIGQNLRSTDAVEFATVNTGHGENELYPMDQAVKTDSDVAHSKMIAATHLGVSSYTSGSVAAKSVRANSTTTLPAQAVGEYRRVTFGLQEVGYSTDLWGDRTDHTLTFYAPSGGLYIITMASGTVRQVTLEQRVVRGGEAFLQLRSTDEQTGAISANSVFIVWRIA